MSVKTVSKIAPPLPVVYSEDHANYLILSSQPHLLSAPLLPSIGRVYSALAHQVTADCLTQFDVTFIVDDGLEEQVVNRLLSELKVSNARFTIALCYDEITRQRWVGKVDSTFCPKSDSEQRHFINSLIESIELVGIVCIDYTDVYCQFCDMSKGHFFQGVAKGKYRAINAIDQALVHYEAQPDTALLVLTAGLDATLDEWESAMLYLDSRLPEQCCTVGTVKILPDELTDGKMMASIFVNQRDEKKRHE